MDVNHVVTMSPPGAPGLGQNTVIDNLFTDMEINNYAS